ncbi:hypothetical protein, conserved [Trypanosoma brucei brucei TREU927]|uniref:Uncharacterized protein n=1 Tax=Trypanosoma brucei brucei (strain 927/4 GUTat10.1) TaxID=185431 RepID=Q57ZU9_TRYB2|nr:hypothetical protein, conserved [Trypanosoma brucei brucei TREU927]AAX79375.1 hypothetical protein, conserved [Trypanosoma brucei]AAZ11386.1 hypothetical protein, conserved [Trypanosoma brucei brucei TREU927]
MSSDSKAIRNTDALGRAYMQLLSCTLGLEKEVEKYYVREEAIIRERVMLLDKIQSNIAEERRCLEIDHQECRSKISATRKNSLSLRGDETKLSQIASHTEAQLDKEEKSLNERLAWVNERMLSETRELELITEQINKCEKNQKLLGQREEEQHKAERDLDMAQRELKSLEKEIDERKSSLEKKHENIVMWNRSLDNREKELARYQEEFREDLRRVEEEERRYGIYNSFSKVAPTVSLREVMDDYNMSIEKESLCEEIERDEEDDTLP